MTRLSDRADTLAAHYRTQLDGANATIAAVRGELAAITDPPVPESTAP